MFVVAVEQLAVVGVGANLILFVPVGKGNVHHAGVGLTLEMGELVG